MTHQFTKTLVLTILLLYVYFFSEWLFFITKPSFLTNLSIPECLAVLFVTPLPLLMLCFLFLTVLQTTSYFFSKIQLMIAVPVLVLGALLFMLMDNFTNTVFDFYTGSYGGYQRLGYSVVFVLLLVLAYLQVSSWLKSGFWQRRSTLIVSGVMILPLISLIIFLFKVSGVDFEEESSKLEKPTRKPNILILSTDGLDAANMSAYGYPRETTPFIDSIVDESLLSENSFSNNTQTTGSIGALYSGKLPTRTGVVAPPSIFTGINIFQHFAGTLRKYGYRSLDVGVPYYADSYDLNLRGAFDKTNFRTLKENGGPIKLPNSILHKFSSEFFFQETVIERIKSRLLHLMFMRNIVDPFKLVTDPNLLDLTDEHRIERLFEFVDDNNQKPFFAHVHFMETHGPKFRPVPQLYSVNQRQDQNWMTDFYDDTLLNFDRKVERVVTFLEQKKLLDDTVIVLTSDHGKNWGGNNRVPLIIKFPKAMNSGRISFNTQRADIPPTLLDYIGVSKPIWMDGDSIIAGELNFNRIIFVAKSAGGQPGEHGIWRIKDYVPPFYSLGALLLIQCQVSYQLDLNTKNMSKSFIENHSNPCDQAELLTKKQAYELMVGHLEESIYDSSQSSHFN